MSHTQMSEVRYSNLLFFYHTKLPARPIHSTSGHKGKRSHFCLVKMQGDEACPEKLQKLNYWIGSWRRSEARVQEKRRHSRQKERCVQTLEVTKASCVFENPQRKRIWLEPRMYIVDGQGVGPRKRGKKGRHGRSGEALGCHAKKNLGFSQ